MLRVLWAVAVSLVFAAACGGGGEEAGGTPTPTVSPVSFEGSTEDALPAGFPEDFPLPDDHTVVYSSWSEAIGGLVAFRTELPDADTKTFMADQLPAGGWQIVTCTTAPVPRQPPSPEGAEAPADATGQPSSEELTVIAAIKGRLSAQMTIGNTDVPNAEFEGPVSFTVTIVRTEDPHPTASSVPCE